MLDHAESAFTGNLGQCVQVAAALKEAVLAHMLRFRFSDFGALQLKRDMSEYQAAVASFNLARVADQFEQCMQLTNMLIVPPASLLDVIETGLQMDKALAVKYIALREDYTTARVNGKTLAAMFADKPPTASAAAAAGARQSAAAAAAGARQGAAGAAGAVRNWITRGAADG